MRRMLAELGLRMMRTRARPLDADELRRTALVLAPHPDDESLACAGTILAKHAAGAEVYLAFMTDGSRSHPISPVELARMRHDEALAAAALLDVPAERVAFLAYEDGALARSVGGAAQRIRELIDRWRPTQLFAPCAHDWHADHIATHEIARAALAGRALELFEYSVYLWRAWPWSPIEDFDRGRRTSVALAASFAARVTHAMECGPLLARKRAALGAHRSQMEKRDPTWWTLGDWANGAFLAGSLSGLELFRKR